MKVAIKSDFINWLITMLLRDQHRPYWLTTTPISTSIKLHFPYIVLAESKHPHYCRYFKSSDSDTSTSHKHSHTQTPSYGPSVLYERDSSHQTWGWGREHSESWLSPSFLQVLGIWKGTRLPQLPGTPRTPTWPPRLSCQLRTPA